MFTHYTLCLAQKLVEAFDGIPVINTSMFKMVAEGFHPDDDLAEEAKVIGDALEHAAHSPPIAREGLSIRMPSVPVEQPQFLCCMNGQQIGTVYKAMADLVIVPGRAPLQSPWEFYDLRGKLRASDPFLHGLFPKIDAWLEAEYNRG